jgi:adenine-specific DNA-methyltransferase
MTFTRRLLPSCVDFLAELDKTRLEMSSALHSESRSAKGQYFTPVATARLMASMSTIKGQCIRVLDPGAGIGILSAAWVVEMLSSLERPREVRLSAFEADELLIPALRRTLSLCEEACANAGICCHVEIHNTDFLEAGVNAIDRSLFSSESLEFDVAILNPPYKKFRADSHARSMLRRIGVEISNLYTAFLSVVVMLLREGGEFVAITPRSFCNGPYFKSFRKNLLDLMSLDRFHIFESRDHAFKDDGVLQENVIFHAIRTTSQNPMVYISQSRSPEAPDTFGRMVSFDRVVRHSDPERFIHLVPDVQGHALAVGMDSLPCTLRDLRLAVSTGRVVDFRARHLLRDEPSESTFPLIYPGHFKDGRIVWPKLGGKKPNAIAAEASDYSLLVPAGVYVLVK